MFAVIKSGGRQYKVSVGQTLEVNRLPVEVGSQVQLDVLLISDANTTMIGTPVVENAMVLATATEHGRGEKLIVFKYKSKKRYRHRRGHRQELTIFTIDDIVADGKSLLTGEAPNFQEEEEEEPVVESEAETETPADESKAQESETGDTEPEAEPEKKASRRRRVKEADDTEPEEEE